LCVFELLLVYNVDIVVLQNDTRTTHDVTMLSLTKHCDNVVDDDIHTSEEDERIDRN
jgi:hypothetical protein